MRRVVEWENWIGRRLRLRDLHVFATVAKEGSMAKAAERLGVTQPAVSKVIADLESALHARLLDRGHRGVELTMYGHALLKRGMAAFDELKQGVLDIDFLADPTSGELRIGCSEVVAAANLPSALRAFSQRYPRVTLSVITVTPPILSLTELQDRNCDLILGSIENLPSDKPFADDMKVEVLIEDRLVVAASKKSPWAGRRKIELAELSGSSWILPAKNTFNYECVMEAFESRGLAMPTIILMAQSSLLRSYFLAQGDYVATFRSSVLRSNAEVFDLKELPVKLTDRRSFLGIFTLKNRTLGPVAERFIEHIREFTKTMRRDREVSRQ
jgi:DNA-binding transcriptional LysR family regulator